MTDAERALLIDVAMALSQRGQIDRGKLVTVLIEAEQRETAERRAEFARDRRGRLIIAATD